MVTMEGETNGDRDPNTHLEQDISIHMFTVSSAMMGVCLTVIGLIRVVITLGRADTLADDCLAGDALLLLASCLLCCWALRSRGLRRMHGRRWDLDRRYGRDGWSVCFDHLYCICPGPVALSLAPLPRGMWPVI